MARRDPGPPLLGRWHDVQLVGWPAVKLMPTGGVNVNTAAAYIEAGAVALGVGSELVDPAALARGEAPS